MSRRVFLAVLAFAVLSPGCVPVAEPVGDIDKAEPDKNLVGQWSVTKGRGTADKLQIKSLTASAPEVKGNPKGLMRGSMKTSGEETPMWFFTSTVGKHTYVNVIIGATEGGQPPTFDEEGAFEKWKKEPTKAYFVIRATRDGDKLTLDCGNYDTFTGLMKEANIADNGRNSLPFFKTPAGWFTKSLDKTAPDKIFDGTNVLELTRDKK
jgi:hypothetical protein